MDRYGVPAERVSEVGGGVNFDPLPVLPSRVPREDAVVLFIGSDFLRKGGDTLVEGFCHCPPKLSKNPIAALNPGQDPSHLSDGRGGDPALCLGSGA